MKEIPIHRDFDYSTAPEGRLILTERAYKKIQSLIVETGEEEIRLGVTSMIRDGKWEIIGTSIISPGKET